jgi:ABC-2 type transport system ATP-binding protein
VPRPVLPHEDGPALLRTEGLTKQYGRQTALDRVSFFAAPGEVLGLIGPNGSGKTTLLETVAGLLPADAGRIVWKGQILPAGCRRKVMFYLPDGIRPYQDQPVARVLSFFAAVYQRSSEQIANIISALSLTPILQKRVSALSKGYNRRLLLALALITPHPLLLMDEPLDGFDPRQTREIMRVLRRLTVGRTLVLAIHQLADAERMCDRFVLLADGRVCGFGSLDELRAQTGLGSGSLEDVFLALT